MAGSTTWPGACGAVRSALGSAIRGLALLALMLAGSTALTGCDGGGHARAPGPTRIVVTLAPLAGLVRDLAPDAEVTVLIPPGASEHGYELTTGDVATVRRADLVVGVGFGLEARVQGLLSSMGASAPPSLWFERVLTPDEGGGGEHAGHDHAAHDHEGHDHDGHSDAGEAGHDHGVDPHVWLDPVLVERFVPVLGSALAGAATRAGAPIAPEVMDARAQALGRRVHDVHDQCAAALAPLAGRAIVTHHASHGRFADRYGLRVAAVIRISETLEPTPGQVQDVVVSIQTENVPAIFVEPQFDATTAERIAEAAGVRVAVLDPIGDGDWFALMESTLRTIVEALGPAPGGGAG